MSKYYQWLNTAEIVKDITLKYAWNAAIKEAIKECEGSTDLIEKLKKLMVDVGETNESS